MLHPVDVYDRNVTTNFTAIFHPSKALVPILCLTHRKDKASRSNQGKIKKLSLNTCKYNAFLGQTKPRRQEQKVIADNNF